ncbi:cytochrome c oxidase subunit II [Natrarchaeobius sp. A-rgal3]|uniref:cytochrome c oxidase subunit II n=1 Tax=Natrarchaeobius versutus TaxID=1679078 RepID=UPI0035107CC8
MQVQTRVEVFEMIFLVFLALGTLVGAVVIAYTLYNAYKYRDEGEPSDDDDVPTLGELPTGGTGGKKLFVSFGLSAIIVISLVVWTYGWLLYVEDGPQEAPEDAIEVDVEGWAFDWGFTYDNGVETNSLGEGMVVPADRPVWIEVTATDVWHTFGISELKVKADAIPGEVEETWFIAEEPGDYTAECFELCGPGHTDMDSDVTVLPQDEFDQWMDEQLTLTITLVDGEEEPVTDGFELSIEHQENAEFEQDLSATLGPEDFEDGTVELGDFEQGGTYDVTITPTDDEFEEIEDTIDFTGPTDETYELEDPDAEDDDDNDDGGDDE